ncbi:UNVERIFIED_CONTAM: hypothetical protein FKN15_032019 [Acipenser sinensis]
MGDIKLPKHMFLWSMSVIYMFAFVSLYVQIPGLYGNDGILPARRMLRYTGKPLLEQLQDSPTLLWLGPQLGLDTQQGMELICLLGTLMAFGAMVWEPLRDALIFLFLWVLYLSLYQALLQVLIILTGNYNFFNLLTIVLSLSLLDDEHVYFFLGHRKQNKSQFIDLVQVDESQYPFKSHPPTFIRARLYKYWFTKVNEDGSVPQKWWRRQFSEEFYPTVFLGDPSLVSLLNHFGLKDKGQPKRNADTFLPVTLRAVREYARPLPAPLILWSLFFTGAAICLLKVLFSGSRSSSSKNKEKEAVAAVEKNDQAVKKEEKEKIRPILTTVRRKGNDAAS